MRHLLLLPVLITLASCAPSSRTVYDLPSYAMAGGSTGACIEQCDIQRVQCRQDADAATGACRSADAAISAGFNGCRPGSPGCVAAPICLADSSRCTAQYGGCYNSCGGMVRTIRTPYLNPDAMPTTPFVVPPLPGAGSAERGGQPIRLRRAPQPY